MDTSFTFNQQNCNFFNCFIPKRSKHIFLLKFIIFFLIFWIHVWHPHFASIEELPLHTRSNLYLIFWSALLSGLTHVDYIARGVSDSIPLFAIFATKQRYHLPLLSSQPVYWIFSGMYSSWLPLSSSLKSFSALCFINSFSPKRDFR